MPRAEKLLRFSRENLAPGIVERGPDAVVTADDLDEIYIKLRNLDVEIVLLIGPTGHA